MTLNDGSSYTVTSRVGASYAAKKGKASGQPQLVLGKEHYQSVGGSWKGAEDLSATASLQWDDEQLYIEVLVKDDSHEQTWQGADIWQGDSLQVGLDLGRTQGAASTDVNELGFALGHDGSIQKHRWRAPQGASSQIPQTQAVITRDEEKKTTSYSITIPFAEMLGAGKTFDPKAPIGVALLINENDGKGRSGFIEYHQGVGTSKDQTTFGELILLDDTYAELLTKAAKDAVSRAESVKSELAIDTAGWHVALLPEGSERTGLQARLAALTKGSPPVYYPGPSSSPSKEPVIEQGENKQTTLRVKADYIPADHRVQAKLSASVLEDAFAKAGASQASGSRTVIVPLDEVKDARGYALEIPAAYFNSTQAQRTLILNTVIGEAAVPNSLFTEEQLKQAGDKVVILLEKADSAHASSGESKTSGSTSRSYPAVKLTIQGNNGTLAWASAQSIQLAIPYQPAETEKAASALLVIGRESEGKYIPVVSSRYNTDQQAVSGRIHQEGIFSVRFTDNDLSGPEWGISAFKALSARGIIEAGSVKQEQLARPITRAEFISQLVRTLELKTASQDNFRDVAAGAAYAQEVGIARQLGIVEGTGDDLFNPDASISRQDAAVMIIRAVEHQPTLKLAVKSGDVIRTFTDAAQIASYAKEHLTKLVQAGIMQGSGNRLLPQGQLTRLEAAALLYRIYGQYQGSI